ncbi:hypothetical protein M433DRAFT_1076 [Acidomyces richmondensis BFW]|nr:MAG: hypothetical protein FE78DRAFT_153344 [Acidomyces sp. 'richmondensis']KYG49515.1 hypothetical protein M433DRAFT_1076 [Acidomyces richmondensis BFW]
MDIFVRNVPPFTTSAQLEKCFRQPFAEYEIHKYNCEKMRNKPIAVVTVLDYRSGQRFLNDYGVPHNASASVRAKRSLTLAGNVLRCSKSHSEPNHFLLKSLAFEEPQKAAKAQQTHASSANKKTTKFDIGGSLSLQCGMWDYEDSKLAFVPYYAYTLPGTVYFGLQEAVIMLGPSSACRARIDISYYNCENIILGSNSNEPTITFTLRSSPKIYAVREVDELATAFFSLKLNRGMVNESPKKSRLLGIDETHAKIAGACWVYRLTFAQLDKVSSFRGLLTRNKKMPPVITMSTSHKVPTGTLSRSFTKLDHELSHQARFGKESFSLRFQLWKLATNARLPPLKVLQLIPKVKYLQETYGLNATLFALRRFVREVPVPTPEGEAIQYSSEGLHNLLEKFAKSYDPNAPDNPYELAKRHIHIKLIHKVVVTPTGTYLEGPEPEPTNRVLRRWPDRTDHFIRVVFQDEDGGPVRYDPRANQEKVYHERFKCVLNGSILIAGQGFAFLGFSHSSLRSQSCWFMAPFFIEKEIWHGERVLKELGDFSGIRVPAKCAARIGQNFTDTNPTINIKQSELFELPMVLRNSRDFSDGVGTISQELLSEVWKVYGTRRLLKPTALQIRFQGYKGMVSLDSRLRGRKLCLRENMKKFKTASSWNLEICGAAFRPLPMILNRQFIKILEDLGVEGETFLSLQKAAVDKLRIMTTASDLRTCATNTAALLDELDSPKTTQVGALIQMLGDIGFDYRKDTFLYGVVDMAIVSNLRDIKYRGRIPVPHGYTLYGIMDETGHLREGEIYVVTQKSPDGSRQVLKGKKVIVTRSPAMHPGDVQVANTVDVPTDSPLQKLSNVVVFSQHGTRDLPSQLGGGDLDGDLYNVIFDQRLVPPMVCPAAEYPKMSAIELDRPVEISDMSDFFVRFMESDLLGMLCNVHMQIADQKTVATENSRGTFTGECIKLAEMASTAVDFSKTGIAVDMKKCPRYERTRPDFMTTSPRVVISSNGYLDLEGEDDEGEDDEFLALDIELRPTRYYKSPNILGQLFRNIDERYFFDRLHHQHRVIADSCDKKRHLLEELLAYVKLWAVQYGIHYRHHIELAYDIRKSYEDSLVDLAYSQSPNSREPVTEQEVFVGQILGRRGGAQGKSLRELAKSMRERFDTVAEYATQRIIHGDHVVHAMDNLDDLIDLNREMEAFPRAIATLEVAVREKGHVDRRMGELKSFRYIAAVVCLQEFRRYRITTFGSRSLPRV